MEIFNCENVSIQFLITPFQSRSWIRQMKALQESRARKVHLISLVTPTWIKDTVFWSHISWQGGTLSCQAAVPY